MSNMREDQEEHLKHVKEEFKRLVEPKYRKGAAEHGTILHELDPLVIAEMALEEAIDQVVYLISLRDSIVAKQLDKVLGAVPADHGVVVYHHGHDTQPA